MDSNSTVVDKVTYSIAEESETLEDVVLQIWNDGLQGVMYDREDMQDIVARLKAAREGGDA